MQTKESEGKEVSTSEAKRLSGSLPVDENRETMLGCTAVANIVHNGLVVVVVVVVQVVVVVVAEESPSQHSGKSRNATQRRHVFANSIAELYNGRRRLRGTGDDFATSRSPASSSLKIILSFWLRIPLRLPATHAATRASINFTSAA